MFARGQAIVRAPVPRGAPPAAASPGTSRTRCPARSFRLYGILTSVRMAQALLLRWTMSQERLCTLVGLEQITREMKGDDAMSYVGSVSI